MTVTNGIVDLRFTLSVSRASTESKTGFHSVHAAAKPGLFSVSKFLSLNGIDVNARDNDSNTALHWSVFGR